METKPNQTKLDITLPDKVIKMIFRDENGGGVFSEH